MFTIQYKGYYIHGAFNADVVSVNRAIDGDVLLVGAYKSVLAAKQRITKLTHAQRA